MKTCRICWKELHATNQSDICKKCSTELKKLKPKPQKKHRKKFCEECGKGLSRGNTSGFCAQCIWKVKEHPLTGRKQNVVHIESRIRNLRGKKRPEHAEKMRKVYYKRREGGEVLSFKGCNHSKEHRERMKGSGNPVWNGGTHFEPYTPVWTEGFKESIRKRDNHTCQVCGEVYTSGRKFAVHHIDYDKKNCQPFNLITLCISCHGMTLRSKEKWSTVFTKKRLTLNNK